MVNPNKLSSARRLCRVAAACAGVLLGASAFAESERGEAAIAGLAASGSNPASGNLSYSVSMSLADARRTELSLPGQARWVVVRGSTGKRRDPESAIPPGVIIDVVLRNGRLLRLRGDGDGGVQASTGPDRRIQYGAELQDPDTGAYVVVDSERGALWVPGGTRGTGRGDDGPGSDGEDSQVLHAQALGDAVPTVSAQGQLAVPALPSARYPHGILGDTWEPRSIYLFATPNRYAERISAAVGTVFETRLALWADTDLDGNDELVLTESSMETGARFVVYESDGRRRAEGVANGRGFRWKHLIGVAPTGPKGEVEIVGVSTPHIGGVIEYYRDRGDHLERVHSRPGYSSHAIGSRNLGMAALGDFNNDGRSDLLVPTRDRSAIAVVQRTQRGSRQFAEFDLRAPVTTNIAVAGFPGMSGMVVLGTADGSLVLFITQ